MLEIPQDLRRANPDQVFGISLREKVLQMAGRTAPSGRDEFQVEARLGCDGIGHVMRLLRDQRFRIARARLPHPTNFFLSSYEGRSIFFMRVSFVTVTRVTRRDRV